MRHAFMNDADTRKALADFVLHAKRLSMGDKVAEFEEAFAKWQGRRFAVMVNSGSSANLALIQALLNSGRLKHGDKVAVSAVTWATNVMPLGQLGLEPMALDVNEMLLCTPREVSAEMIFPTHLLGFSAFSSHAGDAGTRRARLLEDNCESLGTVLESGKTGNFGLASTFSFFVGHHLSTIEGGMICTDDQELHCVLVMVRAHGWRRDLPRALPEDAFTFYVPGFNIRPTEIAGFLGLHQLPWLDESIARRETIYDRLQPQSPLIVRKPPWIKRLSPMALPFICEPGTRDATVKRFNAAGIETRPIVAGNIQRQPFWTWKKTHTPGADRIHDDGFYCGLRPDMTEEEIATIEGCLR
jgi:CDP-6-deoxy-D-xylo-4-hexulose-3-dehydrase